MIMNPITKSKKLPKYKHIVSSAEESQSGIEVETDEYKGVKYRYNVIHINDDGVLKFDYSVEDYANHTELENDPEFVDTIAHILHDIIEKSIEHYENRNNDTQTSSS